MESCWPFCPVCGTILEPPITDQVKCSQCPFSCAFSALNVPIIVTSSQPSKRPAWIDPEKLEERVEKNASIEEPCPKCNNSFMYFYTMQLRSVDEGSTVFYECPKCSHKFSINN
eukprot:gene17275-22809_t